MHRGGSDPACVVTEYPVHAYYVQNILLDIAFIKTKRWLQQAASIQEFNSQSVFRVPDSILTSAEPVQTHTSYLPASVVGHSAEYLLLLLLLRRVTVFKELENWQDSLLQRLGKSLGSW